MINYVDKHIIDFADEWGNKVIPQLKKVKYHDLTEVFAMAKKSRMILSAIAEGKKVYVVGFRNCKGMIRKWLYDKDGRMVREKGRGIVDINPSVITMSAVDINVPFVTSDEVLLVKHSKDRPYNLERDLIAEAMKKAGFSPARDIVFIFFASPQEIKFTINRFVDDFRHLLTKEYCRAKGILAIKDPKWRKYHASDEVAAYTNALFFGGVRLVYTAREAKKQ